MTHWRDCECDCSIVRVIDVTDSNSECLSHSVIAGYASLLSLRHSSSVRVMTQSWWSVTDWATVTETQGWGVTGDGSESMWLSHNSYYLWLRCTEKIRFRFARQGPIDEKIKMWARWHNFSQLSQGDAVPMETDAYLHFIPNPAITKWYY